MLTQSFRSSFKVKVRSVLYRKIMVFDKKKRNKEREIRVCVHIGL